MPAPPPALSVDPAALAAIAALALGVLAWQVRALIPRVGAPRAALLAALRALAVGLAAGLLLGPRVVRREASPVPRAVAVAIDASRSMGLAGGLGETRLARVQAFLASDAFRRLGRGLRPTYLGFSATAAPLSPEAVPALRPDGAATDVAAAVREASRGAAGGAPAAVVVFTDGGHAGEEVPPAVDGAGAVPVVIVGVGAGETVRDVEVAGVAAPAIAFAGRPASARVTVRARGFEGRQVPLLLKRGAQVLASRTVTLAGDGAAAETTVEWTVPAPGLETLAVEVPVQEGEEVAGNNRAEVTVEGVRERIRVLLVSGSPSWSYRFLREALKGDPSVDLVSFIILRTATDAVDVPQQDLALIPFPTQKIFLEELPNFDLLVFDNFAYQPYLPSGYLEKVRDFVAGGGAFWMLGGRSSFLGGRYRETPLASILPVKLAAETTAAGGYRDGALQASLTPAGRSHPIFGGGAFEGGRLPPLAGYNLGARPRPGATVLAESAGPGGAAEPLVVAGRAGKGRALAVLTDSLWSWAFEEAGRGRGNRAFLSFVRQGVRWSVGDPQTQPVRVEPEVRTLPPGGRVRARIAVLGEDFLPAPAAEVAVTATGPGGRTVALAPVAEAPGVLRVEFEAAAEGSWEITATASARGSVYGRASAPVTVAWPAGELGSPGLDRGGLAALVAGRRGRVVELGGHEETAEAIGRALDDLAPAPDAPREESRELAADPRLFLLFLALLGAEWVVRRRSGLD